MFRSLHVTLKSN